FIFFKEEDGIRDIPPSEVSTSTRLEDSLEPVEKLRNALGHEHRGAPFRLALLILVVETGRDRMVCVVGLCDEIGDRELDLMRFESARLVRRDEAVTRSQI